MIASTSAHPDKPLSTVVDNSLHALAKISLVAVDMDQTKKCGADPPIAPKQAVDGLISVDLAPSPRSDKASGSFSVKFVAAG